MAPSPSRSSTGKTARRDPVKDLTAKSHLRRAKRGLKLEFPRGRNDPLVKGRGLNRAHETSKNASIIEYPRPPSAAAPVGVGQPLYVLFALHRLDLLLAFNVNYMYRA